MTEARLQDIYRPNHDEAARQRFVGLLKTFANGELEAQLERRYEQALLPAYRAAHGGSTPQDRAAARPLFESDALYQLWGAMVYCSQNLMWEAVGATCRRLQPAIEARAARASAAAGTELRLQSDLVPPEPIRSVEIHRQPGGYFAARRPDDLHAALLYVGSVELYRNAKGLTTAAAMGEPGIGRFIAANVRRHFPDLQPRRILDLGCGPGLETAAFNEQFPQAEVHGLDLSAPFVRFAHAWCADRGTPIHARQADAQRTGYPDRHFDLIVSHILLHETWHDVMPNIFREAYRILAPGGAMLHADVPYQPQRLSITKQVTNDWQVRNNGEPFWTGFADTDVPALLRAAGFDDVLATYEPLGSGCYYLFGGRRPRSS
ncbi:MAG: class I SAM-dependent methyltransferase [Steroidobacteraceae bacterium]|nr:class I SAM-dependent methyltransferase [Steroidobacteraceae bacterium]MDW8259465.1 methyltransferase domain-containing protein [Gammaproteobacteria bacterium]